MGETSGWNCLGLGVGDFFVGVVVAMVVNVAVVVVLVGAGVVNDVVEVEIDDEVDAGVATCNMDDDDDVVEEGSFVGFEALTCVGV